MRKVSKVILCLFLGLASFSSKSFAEEKSNFELTKAVEMMKNSIAFSGAIELDYSFANDRDIGDNSVNDSTSDLDVGTVELGVELFLHEYVTGNVVLKGENLDADDNIFCDEAVIDIRKEGFPIYFIGGKTGLPFGVFENHLINGPLTEDMYGITDTGLTFGYAPGVYCLDFSVSVYKGEILMATMLEEAYGLDRTYLDSTAALPAWRTGGMSATYAETNDVSSYIGRVTVEPLEGMILGAFYDSEPGDGTRNDTIGGMFSFEISRFTFDMEYISAIQREKDSTDNKEYKESAFTAAMAFQLTDPIEAALRYETFDDDIPAMQDGHLDNRYSVGLNYCLFESDDFATGLSFELRKSNYEKLAGSAVDDDLTEFFAKLAFEF